MKRHGTVKSIIEVTLSNIATILAGIVVGMLLPKIISVEDYGWYKTFTLYTTYIGFFSLGIIDGIVLKHGGDDFEQLNKPLFRSYFKWYALIHLSFSIILIISAVIIGDPDYSFICLMLAVYLVAANFTGYFQQISQITQRFKEYSARKIIYSGLRVINVLMLFALPLINIEPNYRVFLILFMVGECALTIWYMLTYKDIIRGEALSLSATKDSIVQLSKIGFPLLFANLCSTLILSLDRQFVSILFDTETYAKYSFAYNMLSLVTVAMSAISTVLYPTLKRTTKETLKETYSSLVAIISFLVFAAIAAYFPLCFFVEWFLPKYTESLPIFRIVFPGLALSSSITVIMHNYYKTLGINIIYFRKSIVILIVSGLANAVAYILFRSTYAISIASIITMLFWYLYIEQHFVKEFKYDRKKNFLYLIMMMSAFYIITSVPNIYIGFILYIIVYCVITWIAYKQVITKDLPQIIKR